MIERFLWKAALPALVLSVVYPAGALAQSCVLYTEDFEDFSANDYNDGTYRVEWCLDGAAVEGGNFCNSRALRSENSLEDPILWVFVGQEGCTQVRIEYDYSIFDDPLDPLDQDFPWASLQVLGSSDTTKSCFRSVVNTAVNMNPNSDCTHQSHTFTLSGTNRSVYFEFDHTGTDNKAVFIDNVRVSLIGCPCGPGACAADAQEDFGTFFQSGTVCANFPETFDACEGNGPYISSGTACGASGFDYVMTFGTGFPYSAATLNCLDLTGLTEASLQFSYTKSSGSLGPRLDVALGTGSFTNLWRAPFSFPGGCVQECVDLSAYVGQPDVRLKFVSDTSSTSQAHGIDDILFVPGSACEIPEACCFDDGSCQDLTAEDCAGQGGIPQGEGSDCATTTCPLPEACCFDDGSCADLAPDACTGQGGTPQGPGTDCMTTACPAFEACCFGDGSCQDLPPDDCLTQSGVPQGPGADCATTQCPLTVACCLAEGGCDDLSEVDCAAVGGTSRGPGTSCATEEIPTAGAGPDSAMSCATPPIQLEGSVDPDGCTGPVNILWTTDDGNIVSGSTTLTPTVDSPGTYTLHADCGSCESVDSAVVAEGRAPCDLNDDGGVDNSDFYDHFVPAYGSCIGDPQFNFVADLDQDGCITALDYIAWHACWRTCNDVGREESQRQQREHLGMLGIGPKHDGVLDVQPGDLVPSQGSPAAQGSVEPPR